MTKCAKCINHRARGDVHSCKYCQEKKIVGLLNEPFIEFCKNYRQTDDSKKRERFEHKLKVLEMERTAPPPLTVSTIRDEMEKTGATCPAVCKQWVNGSCYHYGVIHPKAPSKCKRFLEEELIRRRKEAKK